MGFWEWLGVKSYKPKYGLANEAYRRMSDTSAWDRMRESHMADWKQNQQSAFGDIAKGVEQKWANTGADVTGVTSSIPGQWQTQASNQWMQNVGNPATRSIEREWMQGTMAQKQQAEETRQGLMEQARAEAMARTGAGGRLLGTLGGAVLGSTLGPIGTALGSKVGGWIGGKPAQPGMPGGAAGANSGYNWNLDPNAWYNRVMQYYGYGGIPQGPGG